MRTENAIITQVNAQGIILEDDFGEPIRVQNYFVVGKPRVGATVTVVHGHDSVRAFVEPEEKVERIASDPDESGVLLVGARVSQLLKAVGE